MQTGKELTKFTPRLRGDEFLNPHSLLNGELSAEEALRFDGPDLQSYSAKVGGDEIRAVETQLKTQFEPTEAEALFLERGVEATTGYLRARTVEGDFLAVYESQARAMMDRLYTPAPAPLLAEAFSQVAIISSGMDESRFAKTIKRRAAYKYSHEELGGVRLVLHQIVLLVVLWPNSGTLRGLADNILAALDEALGVTRFFSARMRGLSRNTPEPFIEVLLQLFNVGALYVYGINSDNVRSPTSNRAFSFLAEMPKAIGMPVWVSGSCALFNHLRGQPAAGYELLHNPPIEISSYSFDDGSRMASAYWAGLPAAICERISEKTITAILEKSAFQRRLYVTALTAVINGIMDNGMSSGKDQLAVADAALARHSGLITAISAAARGNAISGEYKTRYQEFLPLSTRYVAHGRKSPAPTSQDA